MTTIALAEDQVLLRDMLVAYLNTLDGFHVTIAASDGVDLLEQIEQVGPPDILLLDLAMPHMNGQQTAARMRELYPATKILLLSTYDSEMVVVRLLKTGVRGALSKSVHPQDLERALIEMRDRDAYCLEDDGQRLAVLFQQLDSDKASFKKVLLTDREVEYLKLCCSDCFSKEIAERMCLSPRTLQTLADGLHVKVGVKGRVGLAMYAITSGVVHL